MADSYRFYSILFFCACFCLSEVSSFQYLRERSILRNIDAEEGDLFGAQSASVAIGKKFIVVGASMDNENGIQNVGSVTVFRRHGSDIREGRFVIYF